MKKKELKREDGRYLIYYSFSDEESRHARDTTHASGGFEAASDGNNLEAANSGDDDEIGH